jgi:predicted ribosome quality control (RQC) complex YloA/Tae2 family protein
MKIPLLTIYSLAAELDQSLTGKKVTAVGDLGFGAGLYLKIGRGKDESYLILATRPELFVPFLCRRLNAVPSQDVTGHILERQLRGYTLRSVGPWRHDRIMRLELTQTDEVRGLIRRSLIMELVPRRQNLILLDTDRQLILFTLRRVDQRTSRIRQVLTGESYQPPPPSPGLHPGSDTVEDFLKAYEKAQGRRLRERLQTLFPWTSPYLFDDVLTSPPLRLRTDQLAGGLAAEVKRSIWNELQKRVDRFRKGPQTATLILDDRLHPKWLLPYEPLSVPKNRKRLYDTLNQVLEELFQQQVTVATREAHRTGLLRQINQHLRRRRRAHKNIRRDLERAQGAEDSHRAGIILMTHLSHLRKGLSHVILPDPANPTLKVAIQLDPKLTPSENAQRYFRRYRKAQATLQKARHYMEKLDREIEELAVLGEKLQQAGDLKKLQRVKEKMERLGAVTQTTSARSSSSKTEEGIIGRRYLLPQGWTILVGRNNKENDELTHRLARPDDLWLHAQGVPGSHVVLRRSGRKDRPGQRIMEMAAGLAAHFSRSRHSGTVPVMVTEKRHVRKPRGAKPGVVVVEREKTLFVVPLSPEQLAEELNK